VYIAIHKEDGCPLFKMKRKDKEESLCEFCKVPTRRKINYHRNQKRVYDFFVCKRCRPYMCG